MPEDLRRKNEAVVTGAEAWLPTGIARQEVEQPLHVEGLAEDGPRALGQRTGVCAQHAEPVQAEQTLGLADVPGAELVQNRLRRDAQRSKGVRGPERGNGRRWLWALNLDFPVSVRCTWWGAGCSIRRAQGSQNPADRVRRGFERARGSQRTMMDSRSRPGGGSAAAGESSSSGHLNEEQMRKLRQLVHDLNNVITSLLASGHVLRQDLPMTDPMQEVAADIETAGQRASELTMQMRHMLRGSMVQRPALPMPGVLHGSETILLVEDEASVKRTIARILTGAGYEVLAAADGAEALTIAERYDKRIDLLLTDYLMPGVTGDELAKEVQAKRPEIRVLLMSGYLGNRADQQLLPGSAALLPKPFTASSLMARVREALDSRHGLPLA